MRGFIRVLSVFGVTLLLASMGLGQGARQTQEVRNTVFSFFDSFNEHTFTSLADITTEDWVHINPLGGKTSGREAVLRELKDVHSTFLKGVTMKIEEMSVKFATPDVAVATVTNQITPYTTPDGVKHADERQIKTFVVVNRKGKWLITQDQNTIVSRP